VNPFAMEAKVTTRCLVVDDDLEIRGVLADDLQAFGTQVAAAADGVQMRRLMSAGTRFDIVVLDLMLPGEDGLTLCRWVQAEHGVPVIMLTAHGVAQALQRLQTMPGLPPMSGPPPGNGDGARAGPPEARPMSRLVAASQRRTSSAARSIATPRRRGWMKAAARARCVRRRRFSTAWRRS
jgi:CheY-like chemotaxis protein